MRLLMIGDVVGGAGRRALVKHAPELRSELRADFLVVNGENAAGGIGITREIALEMFERAGADVVTLGNHAWGKREVYSYLDSEPRILRPANYPEGVPGRGSGIFRCGNHLVGVAVFQGRIFLDPIEDPFALADAVLEKFRAETPVSLIDFHAEATSEKQAFGWHLDGRATAVIGTHTHVATADERILPCGTAFQTDVGMTGPLQSVIGMRVDRAIERFRTRLPSKFEAAEGPAVVQGVLIEADDASGRALSIQRIAAGPS